MPQSNTLRAEAAHQPLLTSAYLRSLWSSDFAQWRASGASTKLLAHLRAWAAKEWQAESVSEGAFVDVFFKTIWEYTASGHSTHGGGFTLQSQYPVKNAGQGGGTGKADLALGYFGLLSEEPVPQVLAEFKDDRSGLDKMQFRANTRSPVDQCFDYLREARAGRVSKVLPTWALVTDMNEFRLYVYGNKAQYQRFVITTVPGDPAVSLLEDNEEGEFNRFVFARMFRSDWLLAKAGKSQLEKLLAEQLTQERCLEADFYKEYQAYREHLFAELKAANPEYEEHGRLRKLVGITQRLLDRFIFVLYCEDMGAQLGYPPDVLKRVLVREASDEYYMPDGQSAWDRVRRLFQTMRDGGPFGEARIHRFNGGLFAADEGLDNLRVPNSVLCAQNQGESRERLLGSPKTLLFFSAKYNFGLGGDGSGKTLTLTAMGRIFEQSITDLEVMEARAAGRESLAEITKRKRDGVYYTPEWVTKYIVEQTVGRRLSEIRTSLGFDRIGAVSDTQIAENRADGRRAPVVREYETALHAYAAHLDELKVVDPACGSGAFLIQAFQFLYDQRQWVAAEIARVTAQGRLFDTHAAMRSVLANNLYGVDINAESVEITRLALWLHTALPDRPLTSLDDNIRCGNSLVSTDFLEQVGRAPSEISVEELERVNPFSWEEAFPTVFDRDASGFDCVIGNPPYVIFRNFRTVHQSTAIYLELARDSAGVPQYASTQVAAPDLFLPFIERGVRLLNREGKLGYIAPSTWLNSQYGTGLRAFVGLRQCLERWVDFGDYQVFEEATTYTALQFFAGQPVESIAHATCARGDIYSAHLELEQHSTLFSELEPAGSWRLVPKDERLLFLRIAKRSQPLSEIPGLAVGFRGVECGADTLFHFHRLGPNKYEHAKGDLRGRAVELEDGLLRPLASTKDARRYCEPATALWVLFPYDVAEGNSSPIAEAELRSRFPLVWSYFQAHEEQLRGRDMGKMNKPINWWAYTRPMNLEKMVWPKLGVAQTVRRLEVFFDQSGEVFFNNVRVGGIGGVDESHLWFLLGVLNGPVADWCFRRGSKSKQGGYFEANRQYLEPLPVPLANLSQKQAVADSARRLQELHSNRVKLKRGIERRLGSSQCEEDIRPPGWLWADVKNVAKLKQDAPPGLTTREKTRWAKAKRSALLHDRLSEVEPMLESGCVITAHLEDQALVLRIDGVAAIEDVFFNDAAEAGFVAAQWSHALDGVNVTEAFDGKRLLEKLLALRRTDNPAIVEQVVELDRELRELDAEIERAEGEMNQLLYSLYGLSDDEIRLVERG